MSKKDEAPGIDDKNVLAAIATRKATDEANLAWMTALPAEDSAGIKNTELVAKDGETVEVPFCWPKGYAAMTAKGTADAAAIIAL